MTSGAQRSGDVMHGAMTTLTTGVFSTASVYGRSKKEKCLSELLRRHNLNYQVFCFSLKPNLRWCKIWAHFFDVKGRITTVLRIRHDEDDNNTVNEFVVSMPTDASFESFLHSQRDILSYFSRVSFSLCFDENHVRCMFSRFYVFI